MPKILLLLTGMIFLVTTVRTIFDVERTRQLPGGKRIAVYMRTRRVAYA